MPAGYYVTAVDGRRSWRMAGPYVAHEEALAKVDAARRLAERHDPRALFMAWGTARITTPGELPPASLTTKLGFR